MADDSLPVLTELDPQYAAAGTAAQQATLPDALRRLHQAILRAFLDTGNAPDRDWLAARVSAASLELSAAQTLLAAADLVHLEGTGQVSVAYPFSGTPTGYRVHLAGGPPVWAMCAIDALGIPLMTGSDATITATDPHSREPVRIERDGQEWRWNPPTTTVLVVQPAGDLEPGTASADRVCPHIHFVTRPEHASAYLAAQPQLTGALLDQRCAIQFADALFGPLLHGAAGTGSAAPAGR